MTDVPIEKAEKIIARAEAETAGARQYTAFLIDIPADSLYKILSVPPAKVPAANKNSLVGVFDVAQLVQVIRDFPCSSLRSVKDTKDILTAGKLGPDGASVDVRIDCPEQPTVESIIATIWSNQSMIVAIPDPKDSSRHRLFLVCPVGS